MQFFTITNVLAALTTFVTLTTATSDGLPYPLKPMQWTGLSNGVNITLVGMTASQIQDHLKSLDPHWTPVNSSSDIQTRGTEVQGETLCCPVAGWNWPNSNPLNLQTAAQILEGLGGGTITVEPKSCVLAQCYNGAGIWACNEYPANTLEISCTHIGVYAYTLDSVCGFSIGCGQLFDTTGWDVIVHGGC